MSSGGDSGGGFSFFPFAAIRKGFKDSLQVWLDSIQGFKDRIELLTDPLQGFKGKY